MTTFQSAVGLFGCALEVVLLAALVTRGYVRTAPIFFAYIAGISATQTLIVLWPHRFHTPEFWLIHKVVEAALRLGMVLELAHRTFRGFPGAASSALNAMLATLAATALTVISIFSPAASYHEIVTVIVPRIAHGTAWILTALAALVLWYRLPLMALDRAILLGLTPYLLVFTVSMSLIDTLGWHWGNRLSGVNIFAWLGLLAYWSAVAWRSPARVPPLAAAQRMRPLARTAI